MRNHSRNHISSSPTGFRFFSLPAKKRRRRTQRSFLGCANCKARKIKCDENTPVCQRCSERGEECPGLSAPLQWRWCRKHENNATELAAVTARNGGASKVDNSPSASGESLASKLWHPCRHSTLSRGSIPERTRPRNRSPRMESATNLSQINDSQSRLVSFYFDVVCPMFSTFDSDQNTFRSLVQQVWQGSGPVFRTMLSMASAKLSRHNWRYKTLSRAYLIDALQDLRKAVEAASTWTNEILIVILMLGLSTCWHDVQDLGLAHLEAMQRAVLDMAPQSSSETSEIWNFCRDALIYWEMVASLMDDRLAIHEHSLWSQRFVLERPVVSTTIPRTHTKRVRPHPWTGITAEPHRIFAKIVKLIGKFRAVETQTGSAEELAKISHSVGIVEDELWNTRLPSLGDIADMGDECTPPSHHLLLAEAYMFANIYQLCQVFKDRRHFIENRLIRPGFNSNEGEARPDRWISECISLLQLNPDTERWIASVGRKIISRLEQVPDSSGTSCVQPLLLLVGSSSLSLAESKEIHDRAEVLRLREFLTRRLTSFALLYMSEPMRQVGLVVAQILRQADLGTEVLWIETVKWMGLVTIIG